MPSEHLIRTVSPLGLGQLVLAAATVDGELVVSADGLSFVISTGAGEKLLLFWPSLPDELSGDQWIAEAYELSTDVRASLIVEALRVVGSVAQEV
ncbi:hypothetical protein R8Z57_07370 [Microbacterium sp. M3]|uniref:Uncharacterized protein n=1 Tax=Microbacterium arthrosphaerae TaxID=792652 RepID=A0ABU4GZT7_9MICO|nr:MULTISPECIES: hypothetical protein [Microbacterium]MDW4572598.1 hypothetical protein [Microbacterium arthrosphaerae]MDW7606453.1 hypothetical protein [Microbacterium sp. M3]